MPFFNYGGALGINDDVERAMMQYLQDNVGEGVSHIEYRDTKQRASFPQKTGKMSLLLRLPEVEETLWQDVGTPVYGKSFFQNILSETGLDVAIAIVYYQHRPVSAGFLIAFRDTLEIPWASTLRQANQLNANMFLYWHILKYAIKRKFEFFDFGRSSSDAGTFRFKQQWGAKPQQLYWHYWLPCQAELPELNPNNPKFRILIAVWRRLPVWLTKIIGPRVVKNLP